MDTDRMFTNQFEDKREIRHGHARILFVGSGWALPGGFITPDRNLALRCAEQIDAFITKNTAAVLPVPQFARFPLTPATPEFHPV